jgi:hypothetical protein
MTDDRHELIPVSPDNNTGLRNKTNNLPTIRTGQDGANDYVSHLISGDVGMMVVVARYSSAFQGYRSCRRRPCPAS